MSTSEQRYEQLKTILRDISGLESAASLLSWDQQVNLPPRGGAGRAAQLATIAALLHERRTDPAFVELVQELSTEDLPEEARENVTLVWREIVRAKAVPRELVRAIAKVSSETHDLWLDARRNRSFAVAARALEELVSLKRAYGEALCSAEGIVLAGELPFSGPYDALLDGYERGARAAVLEKLFRDLRTELAALLQAIVAAGEQAINARLYEGPYPRAAQERLFADVVRAIGFDLDAGRIDETVHPFCSTIGPGDVRLCTRYDESNLFGGLFGIIHEAGHGLYEQGLLAEQWGLPLGEACSLGIHESQSLLWEKHIGRSLSFWERHYSLTQDCFPEVLSTIPLEEFYRYVNRVRPSLIRVNADEVSYSLHVILRFELERALIGGDLKVHELSSAWNESYRSYLGIEPPDEVSGVLQDTHWYSGLIGYFPTYTLGAMYAAQLAEAFVEQDPNAAASLQGGEPRPLLHWLQERIYRHGQRYAPAALIEHATGRPPSPEPMLKYLRRKYGEMYGLS